MAQNKEPTRTQRNGGKDVNNTNIDTDHRPTSMDIDMYTNRHSNKQTIYTHTRSGAGMTYWNSLIHSLIHSLTHSLTYCLICSIAWIRPKRASMVKIKVKGTSMNDGPAPYHHARERGRERERERTRGSTWTRQWLISG